MVAQAVERWHSVQGSRVQILGWTWLFVEMLSIFSHLASGYLLREQVVKSATYSSFFIPVSYRLYSVNISIVSFQ